MQKPQEFRLKSMSAAVAILCATGFAASPSFAAGVPCGTDSPGDTSLTTQCDLTPFANNGTAAPVFIETEVSIRTSTGTAVLYNGDLSEESPNLHSFTNAGTVEANGMGGVSNGLEITGNTYGNLGNVGSILSYNDAAFVGSAQSNGIKIGGPGGGVGSVNSAIINSGQILSSASSVTNSAHSAGILITRDLNEDASIYNTGSITATARGTEGSAVGISMVGTDPDSVDGGLLVGTLRNEGTISASVLTFGGSMFAAGVMVKVVGSDGTIINDGSITAADSSFGGNNASIGVVVGTLNGSLTNRGLIRAQGEDVQSSLFIVDGNGTVENEEGGRLVGGLSIGGVVAVNNNGLIDLRNASQDQHNYIGGNFNQSALGRLSLKVSASDSFQTLVVGGVATLGGVLDLDVEQSNTLAVGEQLGGVLNAEGGISGQFAAVQDNSQIFNFVQANTTNSVNLVVTTEGADPIVDIVEGEAKGSGAVFDALIAGRAAGNAEMAEVITALGKLGTAAEVSDALLQTVPLFSGGQAAAVSGTLVGLNSAVQVRQDDARGLSSGDGMITDGKLWVRPFGSSAEQGNVNGVSGYRADTAGVVFGGDTETSGGGRFGLALGVSNSTVKGKSAVAYQSSKIQSYQLAAYGSVPLSGATEFSYQADIGKHGNEGRRNIDFFNTAANADYDSTSAHVGVALSRAFKTGAATTLVPSIGLDYTKVRDDGYTETDAGALNLIVQKRKTDSFVLSADIKANHDLTQRTTLAANFGVGYDMRNKQATITSAFAGASSAIFTTQGIKPDAVMARAGLGIVHKTVGGAEFSARYDVESRDSFLNQTLSAKMRWAF